MVLKKSRHRIKKTTGLSVRHECSLPNYRLGPVLEEEGRRHGKCFSMWSGRNGKSSKWMGKKDHPSQYQKEVWTWLVTKPLRSMDLWMTHHGGSLSNSSDPPQTAGNRGWRGLGQFVLGWASDRTGSSCPRWKWTRPTGNFLGTGQR